MNQLASVDIRIQLIKSPQELQQYSQQFGIIIRSQMSSLSSQQELRSAKHPYSTKQKLYSRTSSKASKNNEESNDLYYETNNQQYRNVGEKSQKNNEDMSELSFLIYQGLDKARKQVKEQKIANMLTEIYKKQLQIQIDLCKEMEALTMTAILNEKQIQIVNNISKMEVEVDKLKKELQQFQRKKVGVNSNRIIFHEQMSRRESSYQIYRTSCGKMEKHQSGRQFQQNVNINLQPEEYEQNQHKLHVPTKNIHYQNSSTNPSRESSFLTGPNKNYHETNFHIEKKNLLFKRLNLIKDQLENTEIEYLKKEDMIHCELDILRRQIALVDEALGKNQNIDERKRQITPTRTHIRQQHESQKKRSPRLKSCGNLQKINKKSLFKNAKKLSKPSLFANIRQTTNSSLLKRHASENKMVSQLCYGQRNFQSIGSKFNKINSNMVRNCREEDNEYYSSRMIPHFEKNITANKIKNSYYN